MKKLENLFNELLEDKSSWDYYRSLSLHTEGIDEVFTKAGSFVEAYLAKGSKLDEDTRAHINLLFHDGNRIEHTLSIYFLGILFYEKVSNIKNEVDSYLEYVEDQIDSEYEKTPFSYYWF